ncbi:MAG: hypothetical protein ACI4IE_02180 [Eubacterium sp.]
MAKHAIIRERKRMVFFSDLNPYKMKTFAKIHSASPADSNDILTKKTLSAVKLLTSLQSNSIKHGVLFQVNIEILQDEPASYDSTFLPLYI